MSMWHNSVYYYKSIEIGTADYSLLKVHGTMFEVELLNSKLLLYKRLFLYFVYKMKKKVRLEVFKVSFILTC